MTKLTKQMRENFVMLAMQDVPKIDYHTKAQDFVNKACIAALPPLVRAAYDAHPEFVGTGRRYVSGLGSFCYPGSGDLSAETRVELDVMAQASGDQCTRRTELQIKLMGEAMSASTVEKLLELLPEFKNYVEPKPVDTKNLPALANVVADFVAAGWPAGKAGTEVAT